MGGIRIITGTQDSTLTAGLAGAVFVFPLCFLLASMIAGAIIGLSIEIQVADD